MNSSTASRNTREKEFHDEWAASLNPSEVPIDVTWTAVTCPEHRWFRPRLGNLRGKAVLDLGCGAGEAAVWFAKQGANVVASDLSQEFLNLVNRIAAVHGVSVVTHLADADRLTLPDESFDIIYAGNLLHHVNLCVTLDQILRLLRPGGLVVTWDPLIHNPFINIYRKMASAVRTSDERPLSIGDLEEFKTRFERVEYECFWFFTLWIFLRFFLIEHIHPSKERYWKKIVIEHHRLSVTYLRLDRIDRWLLSRIPWLKRFCWTIAIAGYKPVESARVISR